jgi:hypothetical protein
MRHLAHLTLTALLLVPSVALAQPFAEPPDNGPVVAGPGPEPIEPGYDRPYERHYPRDDDFYAPRSTVRIYTGPVLRLSQNPPDGGLFAAIDVGEKAAGLRVSGAWVRVGAERGLSQYGGELWIDFNYTGPLHPILGAGASAARIELATPTGETESHTIGVGTLRGTLQYALPIKDTDARASIDAIGAVPAIRGQNTPEVKPYVLLLATVGVGF